MNWDVIAGDWRQLKGRVKHQWEKLTENNFDGKRNELAGKIQEACRATTTKEEATKPIKILESSRKDYDSA